MEAISKYEVSPFTALLNMIKINYFGKSEIYKMLLAVLSDYDSSDPNSKAKTKHYIQLLLSEHQDLSKCLLTFLPGECDAENIPLGQIPVATTVSHQKRPKRSKHRTRRKIKGKRFSCVKQIQENSSQDSSPELQAVSSTTETPKQNKGSSSPSTTCISPKPVQTSTCALVNIDAFPYQSSQEDIKEQQLTTDCDTVVMSSGISNLDTNIGSSCSSVISSKNPLINLISARSEGKPDLTTRMVTKAGTECNSEDVHCFPEKYGEAGNSCTPIMVQRPTTTCAINVGIPIKDHFSSQQTSAAMNNNVIQPTMMPNMRIGHFGSAIPTQVSLPLTYNNLDVPVHSSRMVPLYNVHSNSNSALNNQALFPPMVPEPSVNPRLNMLSVIPVEQTGNVVSIIDRPDSMIPAQANLVQKSISKDVNLPQNLQRPEPLMPGYTGTPKGYLKDNINIQWAMQYDQFSATRRQVVPYPNNHIPYAQSHQGAKLACSTLHATYEGTTAVPHLYTLPQSSTNLASFIPHQIQHHPSSHLPHPQNQMSSPRNKVFLNTASGLSAFPYTRQLILPDGQTKNMYLKRSSINMPLPDGKVTTGGNTSDNHFTGSNSGQQINDDYETRHISHPMQTVKDKLVNASMHVSGILPAKVSVRGGTLQQLESSIERTRSPMPFFIGDHQDHPSKLLHSASSDLVEEVEGRGDADILEKINTPRPKKVVMTSNQGVRKKLRLTPCKKSNLEVADIILKKK